MSIDEIIGAEGMLKGCCREGGGICNSKCYIGMLDPDKEVAKQKFLLNTAELDKTHHNTIARLFDESIKILGEGVEKDSILLFISNAAVYMVKATRTIKIFYPKITRLTCLAHDLHRVYEQIRSIYSNIN